MTAPRVDVGGTTFEGERQHGVEVFADVPFAAVPGPFEDSALLAPGSALPESSRPLFLTLTRPAGTRPQQDLPVLVWIHGGGYVEGTRDECDAAALVRHGQIIVVSLDYRLGAQGFIPFAGDPPGHYRGIDDCLWGLEWVQKTVEAFGGDPSQVTLAGHSAGAGIALWLCRKDHYRGAFRRAMAFSAAYPRQTPEERKKHLRRALGVAVARRHLTERLRKKPEAFARGVRRFRRRFLTDMAFGPAPCDPTELSPEVSLLLTYTTHELYEAAGPKLVDRWCGRLATRLLGRSMGLTVPVGSYLDAGETRPFSRLSSDSAIRRFVAVVADRAPGQRWLLELARPGNAPALHGAELPLIFSRTGPLMTVVERFCRGQMPGWRNYQRPYARHAHSLELGGAAQGRNVEDPLKEVRVSFAARPAAEGPPILRGKWG